jgi:hypothetical protein
VTDQDADLCEKRYDAWATQQDLLVALKGEGVDVCRLDASGTPAETAALIMATCSSKGEWGAQNASTGLHLRMAAHPWVTWCTATWRSTSWQVDTTYWNPFSRRSIQQTATALVV